MPDSKIADWIGIILIVVHYSSYVLLTAKLAFSDLYDALLASANKYATGNLIFSIPVLAIALYYRYWRLVFVIQRNRP